MADAPAVRADQPLRGIRVLDLGQIYAGGYAGFLLAAAGADVLKIEPPQGENLRRRDGVGGGSYPFAMLNGSKRGVALDLKTEAGADVLRDLVSRSDVLIENFAPGVMDRLGLGYDHLATINARLVYGSVSGYGRSGVYRDYPAMDLTVQAMVGVMDVTGFPGAPPVKAGPALCDFLAGVHLTTAVCMALVARDRGGAGQRVEVTMQEATYPALASSLGMLFGSQGEPAAPRTGNRHSGYGEAPYNVFEAADGFVAILCVSDAHWVTLAGIIGGAQLAEDPRYMRLADRVARMDDVDDIVATRARSRTRDEITATLLDRRVPCAPVNRLREVVEDPNLWHRGMLHVVDHPNLGGLPLNHSPLRFGDAERVPLEPSPRLGEHTTEVLVGLLGYSDERIQRLRDAGAVAGSS